MVMKKIAFIGLGNMGKPMALNLSKAGFKLNVFDLVPAACEELRKAGADVSDSATSTLKGASIVISMLPSSPHVEGLYLGAQGLLAHAEAGTLFIDCSTIAPDSAKKVSQAAKTAGFKMLDAPVSGGTKGATEGTLTFIVGGEKANLELARPALEKMGRNIFHAGENGAGQVAKICNNMLLAIHMAGTAEALALGVKNGMDPRTLSEIMLKSSGRNWSLEVYNPYPGVMDTTPASKGYQGGFAVDLMKKDLGLSQEAANAVKVKTEMGALVLKLYERLSADGAGKLDFSSILKLYT
jgi:3-hydroxyisobutyrate dehydrogenase